MNVSRDRRCVTRGLLVAVALATGLASACAPDAQSLAPIRVADNRNIAVPERRMVMFLVDGLDHEVFSEMVARGELPEIEEHLIRRGVSVENAVTCIPSITYAAQVTLLTGRQPGHHDILGDNWFDRRTLIWKTYNIGATYRDVDRDYTAPTVHQILGDQFTVNFQCAVRRGVTKTVDNWAESGICWLFGWHRAVDRWVGSDFEQLEGISRHAGRWPAFVHAYFPGVDACAHQAGSDSPLYREALRNVDGQIGSACDAMARVGLLDGTYLLLVSDHGHTPCPRENFIDVSEWLRKTHGWKVHEGRYGGATLERRQRYFAGVDATGVTDGSRVYMLYLRGPDGWLTRPDYEQCKEVLTACRPSLGLLPAVLVGACRRAPNQVWLYGRDGEATVTRRWSREEYEYRYDAISRDPLGYRTDATLAAFVQGGWHGSRSWLAATAGTHCPDTVAQIVELFDSPRSPDIALFAVEGWDFSREDVGGHGSIVRRDMWIPMIFAGPGIQPSGRIATARACDVAPTIVELLAGSERASKMGPMDGKSLASQLLDTRYPSEVVCAQ